jgi:hypothetical protein
MYRDNFTLLLSAVADTHVTPGVKTFLKIWLPEKGHSVFSAGSVSCPYSVAMMNFFLP